MSEKITQDKQFQEAQALSEALVGGLINKPPRVTALALMSTLAELARHPATGPQLLLDSAVVGEVLGFTLARERLPRVGLTEPLLMERPTRTDGVLDGGKELAPMPLGRMNGVAFDLDGPIRYCTVPGQPCPNKDGEWALCPGVQEFFFWILREHPTVKVGFATNQGGVERGYLDLETAARLAREAMAAATGNENRFQGIVCPSNDPDDPSRKPNPGMLHWLAEAWGEHPSNLLYVGDWETDRQAAMAAGWWYIDHRQLISRWAP